MPTLIVSYYRIAVAEGDAQAAGDLARFMTRTSGSPGMLLQLQTSALDQANQNTRLLASLVVGATDDWLSEIDPAGSTWYPAVQGTNQMKAGGEPR